MKSARQKKTPLIIKKHHYEAFQAGIRTDNCDLIMIIFLIHENDSLFNYYTYGLEATLNPPVLSFQKPSGST